MKTGTIVLIGIGVLTACGLYAHRRVIRAWIEGEPMPEAPSWHFWVDADQRRADGAEEADAAE